MRASRGALVSLAAGALAFVALAFTATDAFAQGGGRMRGERGGPDNAPKVGATAPDFDLKVLDVAKGAVAIDPHTHKQQQIKLTTLLQEKKPVALIFGSYT